MRTDYKSLGEFVELVKSRNDDLKHGEMDIRGVSKEKKIIPSRANNKSRALNEFYVVKPNDFIYNSRTTRMGDKVGLGFNNSEKTVITTFNNTVFRVTNKSLLPSYLFMWLSRPEFDRYARFHSWGSSTELFSWEQMCQMKLPIPSIQKQNEITQEYRAFIDRIELNERMNKRIEELALTLYRQWFGDQQGYSQRELGLILTPQKGKNITRAQLMGGDYPVIAGGLNPTGYHNVRNTLSPVVTVSASGNAGYTMIHEEPIWASDCSFIDPTIYSEVYFAYCCLKVNEKLLMSLQTGTAQRHIYPKEIMSIPVFHYSDSLAKQFNDIVSSLFERIGQNKKMNKNLELMARLLLDRMIQV